MIELARVEEILQRLPALKIGLIGDLFLDRYLDIDRALDEVSIETGLTAYQVAHVRNNPGALGTVLNNLSALGVGKLVPVSVIGDDGHGYDLLKAVESLGITTERIVRHPGRMTPTYTKPMRDDEDGVRRELNRLDVRSREMLDEPTQAQLNEALDETFADCDAVVVLDQLSDAETGVVNSATRRHLSDRHQRTPEKLVFVDSRAHIAEFDCGVLKPNHEECLRAAGKAPSEDIDAIREAAEALSARHRQVVFCTLGGDGMLVIEPGGTGVQVPAYRVSGPVDIVGAGDSATSGIVCGLLSGANSTEAAAFGNLVASITVQQLGTTGTARPDQVVDRWRAAHER